MEAPFKIGQKVVCIDDSNQENPTILFKHEKVVKGKAYTIRSFRHDGECWGVRLVGVIAGFYNDMEEGAFKASRFAPLPEQRERIKYVAVSETLRETAVEIAAVETN